MVGKQRSLSSGFGGTSAGISSTPPQHMYLLEGGLLVVSNLLKTNAWVHDTERSHCNVCVQQFMPFRRRHHCRTCGEVVCGNCSSQRKIHLTEVNVECATRVCSFCMIRATDAAIHATNECLARESIAVCNRRASLLASTNAYVVARPGAPPLPLPSPPPPPPPQASSPPPSLVPPTAALPPTHPRMRHQPATSIATATPSGLLPPRPGTRAVPYPHHGIDPARVSKQMSMLSLESDLTEGSVVQLWPPVATDNETVRLEIARNSTIRKTESDPTMSLLVSIVARTLECPVAFIGILDDDCLWFKASVGWDRTHISREDCVCALQQRTMIVADTNHDKHFHANTLTLGNAAMRYYAGAPIRVLGQCIGAVSAIDSKPHWDTSASMKSTLEAVASIVSEVLEQRVDGSRKSMDPLAALAANLPASVQRQPFAPSEERPKAVAPKKASPPTSSLIKMNGYPKTQSTSSCESESTLLDFSDALRDLRAVPASECSLDSESEDGFDLGEQRASETALPASAVHPWPVDGPIMGGRMSTSNYGDIGRSTVPRFSLAIPVGPPEVGEKVAKAMEFFQALQSSRWTASEANYNRRGVDDGVLSFELFSQGRHFTKSHAKIAGDCTHVIARLQTYDDGCLYADLIEHVTQRREKLSVQTWIDHVQLRAGFEGAQYDQVRVLSHWRQYPDGSNVIVAFNDTNPELLMIEDFLFGWFISPSIPDEDGQCCVNVSAIIAQPVSETENQQEDNGLNLSKLLLQRLQHTLPHHYDISSLISAASDQSLSTSSCVSSVDNQRSIHTVSPVDSFAMLGSMRPRSSTSTSSAGDKVVAIRTKYTEVSNLNENERMMLDLLDKTISTQEVLAAQQHVMANVMDYHGTQLQRISTAIDRVENILQTNDDRLKQMKTGREGREGGSRHSVSI